MGIRLGFQAMPSYLGRFCSVTQPWPCIIFHVCNSLFPIVQISILFYIPHFSYQIPFLFSWYFFFCPFCLNCLSFSGPVCFPFVKFCSGKFRAIHFHLDVNAWQQEEKGRLSFCHLWGITLGIYTCLECFSHMPSLRSQLRHPLPKEVCPRRLNFFLCTMLMLPFNSVFLCCFVHYLAILSLP